MHNVTSRSQPQIAEKRNRCFEYLEKFVKKALHCANISLQALRMFLAQNLLLLLFGVQG